MELLGPSVEGNVETLLNALRYAIPVDRVAVPVARWSTRGAWRNMEFRSMRWCAPTASASM